MTYEIGTQLAVGQVPHLNQLVPAAGDDDRVSRCGGEAHTTHPAGMRIRVLNSILTLPQGIPQLDGLVPRAGHNLPVVNRECNTENILGVSYKAPGCRTCVQIPQSQGSIPRAGERKLSIRRDDHILDKVRVASEAATREAIVSFFSGQVPDDDAFVSRRRQDEVWVVKGASDGCYPARMSLECTPEHKRLCHDLTAAIERFLPSSSSGAAAATQRRW